MKFHTLFACAAGALILAGCSSSVNPLGGAGEGGISMGQSAPAEVTTLPPHGNPEVTASIRTAIGTSGQGQEINEQAAAEAEAAMAREFASSGTAGKDSEQTVEEQIRLRELMNRGELHEEQPLPEDN